MVERSCVEGSRARPSGRSRPRGPARVVARVGERDDGGDGRPTDPTERESQRPVWIGRMDGGDGGAAGAGGEPPPDRTPAEAGRNVECPRCFVRCFVLTVVISTGMGVNPFKTPGFVPGGASTATVEEKLGQAFRLSLPFTAGAGGQRVSLQLQGPQANQLSVLTESGVQAIGANGSFELTVPEGQGRRTRVEGIDVME